MYKSNKIIILKKLANLPFALGLLFTIGFIIAVGTIIEQDQGINFYKENYSESNPILGFLNWKIILLLGLDRVYSVWWFLATLLLFSISLLACTLTTQLPSIKTFKIWKFKSQPNYHINFKICSSIKFGISNTIAFNCNINNYHFFRQQKKGYAYSGLLGRVAPVIVHFSIIVLIIGTTLGSFTRYTGQEIIPRGEIFHFQNLTTLGNISYIPQALFCRINNFWITYTKDLKTDQFYSDLSIFDETGSEKRRKIIFVNEPLSYRGFTMYQTDWGIVGLKLRLHNEKIFQVPLKNIAKDGNRFWFGSLSLDSNLETDLTVLINDLNGKIYLYNSNGVLIHECDIGGDLFMSNNLSFQFSDVITSSGLQMKGDLGLGVVYLAFFFLITSIYVSFFTYSQIWVLELAEIINVSGNSNRSVLFFQTDVRKIIRRSSIRNYYCYNN